MLIVQSFCGLCLLLFAGKLLRTYVPLFQRLYLPSSILGGLLGLAVIHFGGNLVPAEWHAGWGRLPGFLINLVFATLFLGRRTPGLRRVWAAAAPQLCFGQLLAWGQYVIGFALTAAVLLPLFKVPDAFGNLLEIGFEGGHGTVGGMAESFVKLGWAEGVDLGLTVATLGMMIGIVGGMALINWAARRGHVAQLRSFSDQSLHEQRGIYHFRRQPSAGRQTVASDSVDSLAWHIALLGIALFFGWLLKQGLSSLQVFMPASWQAVGLLESFPLFPLCMFGGLLVQKGFEWVRLSPLISHQQMARISGSALDFLVISALATINVRVVSANWLPLLLLAGAGTLWSVFCVLYLAPRLFSDAWFERAIAEFGQSCGVTATGLLLLRTVDPENETVAAEAFGYKQLLHEPVMGGGLWTSLALPMAFALGSTRMLVISCLGLLPWCVYAVWLNRQRGRSAGSAIES